MAKYSRGSVILIAAVCLGGTVYPPALTAPAAPLSSDAVGNQMGNKQIAVDNPLCYETGMRVLKAEGNNAVDAAVATLLCLGVVNFQSSGIGGGMVMVVAEKDPNGGEPNVTVIDARVVAPESVDDTMGVPYVNDETLALIGPSSIAVPGELKGMKMALEMFSEDTVAKRNTLFEDAIRYAQNGFEPSEHLLRAIQSAIVDEPTRNREHSFKQNQSAKWFEGMRELVQKSDGSGYIEEGDTVRPRPMLVSTLRRIVQNGFDDFYNGMTATRLLNDINSVCATEPPLCRGLQNIITAQDLTQYEVKNRTAFNFSYDSSSGYNVYTAPAPYGGPALAVFLGIVTRKVDSADLEHNVYHYLTEAAKFAASYRMEIGDPDFNSTADVTPAQAEDYIQNIIKTLDAKEQARPDTDLAYYRFVDGKPADGMGTTHLSVITPDMAVTVTSSINDFFGSGYLSPSTGILLNNDMDGFSLDGRFPFNKIEARKRPLSAMCPTVVVDRSGNFTLVTGAAGGKRIPPAVGQTMFFALTKKTSAKVASCQPRVYADLDENEMNSTNSSGRIVQQVEKNETSEIAGLGFPSNGKTLMWLRDDHKQEYEDYTARSVVQSILINGSTLDAHSDVRKYGGDCVNTTISYNWGIHPNVKLLLIFFSFVVQCVCVYV